MGHWFKHHKVVREFESEISQLKAKQRAQAVGVCALLLNPEEKILLGVRKNSYKSGFYGMPGGHVEVNEPLLDAVKREVAEETGLTELEFKYVGVIRQNQGEYDFIHFVFVAQLVVQTPQLCEPDKCEGWGWYPIDALPKNVLEGHKAAIEMYLEKKSLLDITSD